MSLLANMASGEYKPDAGYKDFAKDVLDDINFLKSAAFTATENPNIDIKVLLSKMYTEPASLDGHMTRDKYLTQDVFQKREHGSDLQRDAAQIMIDYATGDKAVDPVILYKASKIMEEAGLPVDRQWGRVEHASTEDGGVREYGVKKIFISERDAMRRQDIGERKGIEENTQNRIKNLLDCYRSGK